MCLFEGTTLLRCIFLCATSLLVAEEVARRIVVGVISRSGGRALGPRPHRRGAVGALDDQGPDLTCLRRSDFS